MPAPPAAAHEETGETTKAGYPKEHFGHGHEVRTPWSSGPPFSPSRCTHVLAVDTAWVPQARVEAGKKGGHISGAA